MSVSSVSSLLESFGLSSLNWLDYILLSIVAFSTLISLVRGFLREAMSLITWILAFWIALRFSQVLASYLVAYIPHATLRSVIAIILLLVAALLAGMLVTHCAEKLIKQGKLSFLDRVLGIVFGFARGVLVVSLLLFFGHVLALDQNQTWKKSSTIPLLNVPVTWLQNNLSHQVEKISVMMLLKQKDGSNSVKLKQGEAIKQKVERVSSALTEVPKQSTPETTSNNAPDNNKTSNDVPTDDETQQPVRPIDDRAQLAPAEVLR